MATKDSRLNVIAQKYLNFGLGFLGVGTMLLSIGAVLDIVSSSSSTGVPFEVIGAVILVSVTFGMIVALLTTHPTAF